MQENNFVNQLRKYKEDLDIQAMEPTGFKLNEYTYVLGDKQKQMIIDEVAKRPYGVFRYYFLTSSSPASDMKLMKKCFDDLWELNPTRGYLNLTIITDDGHGGEMTYTNRIDDIDFVEKIVKSIEELGEDLEIDYPQDASELYRNNDFKGYRMSTNDKLNFIKWIKNISPEDARKFWCNLGTITEPWVSESMEEHLTGRWGLGMYDTNDNTIELMGSDKFTDEYNETHFWTMLCEFPVDFLYSFLEKDADKIIKFFKGSVTEDLELDYVTEYNSNDIAQALAEKIGDCIVDGNVIYQMMNDFEIYIDGDESPDLVGTKEDTMEVPYGIFAIYEVLPDGGVIAWNSSAETCEDVDEIGHKPLTYFRGTPIQICSNIKDFIDFLDSYFGRDWFGTPEETEDFLNMYSVKEDLELSPLDLSGNKDAYEHVLHGGMTAVLNDIGKEDVAIFLDMEEETWDSMKEDNWYIVANSEELDRWFDPVFPFALLIGDRFYDALSDSVGEDILNHHKEGFYLE